MTAIPEFIRAGFMMCLVLWCLWAAHVLVFGKPAAGSLRRRLALAAIAIWCIAGMFRTITGRTLTLWPEGPSRMAALADWAEGK